MVNNFLVYNEHTLPANRVPRCKVTLCDQKATKDCEGCGDPICNGHVSFAVQGHICQWCRFMKWQQEQGGQE